MVLKMAGPLTETDHVELLRNAECDRLVLLVRLGAQAFAVQWADGRYHWRAISRVKAGG